MFHFARRFFVSIRQSVFHRSICPPGRLSKEAPKNWPAGERGWLAVTPLHFVPRAIWLFLYVSCCVCVSGCLHSPRPGRSEHGGTCRSSPIGGRSRAPRCRAHQRRFGPSSCAPGKSEKPPRLVCLLPRPSVPARSARPGIPYLGSGALARALLYRLSRPDTYQRSVTCLYVLLREDLVLRLLIWFASLIPSTALENLSKKYGSPIHLLYLN